MIFFARPNLDDKSPVEGGGARVAAVGEAHVGLDAAVLRVAVVRHREPFRTELLLVLDRNVTYFSKNLKLVDDMRNMRFQLYRIILNKSVSSILFILRVAKCI